ncbi:MAG: NAD(P)-binding domain-containing protein [Bacteroidia bacterium]|nr:NAD(P)-binding domain-containing protein [Bacteroidia bacterium]
MAGMLHTDTDRPRIAVLGLGEAGSNFANGLASLGLPVSGWDPAPRYPLHEHVQIAESNLAAAGVADIILSVNISRVAAAVVTEVMPVLGPHQVFVEMNTASPAHKQTLAAMVAPSGAAFVDLAIMAPVPPAGIFTPFWVSGPGAQPFQAALKPYGLQIEYLGEAVGMASTRKLLRSIVYKGFAAVICEALEAGRALELEPHVRTQISSLIGGQDELIDRFETGSKTHALRRNEEMHAVVEMITQAGLNPVMSRATRDYLFGLISHT